MEYKIFLKDLNRMEPEKELGSGAFGVVFSMIHQQSQTIFAVKVIFSKKLFIAC